MILCIAIKIMTKLPSIIESSSQATPISARGLEGLISQVGGRGTSHSSVDRTAKTTERSDVHEEQWMKTFAS